ncbi:LmbU family transcriptional regulator [Saccharopolyspora sp. NPDC050389]|uniref:LmbU family transcriptional regulator n=1 Tax=Saccharopolyspora sp. NPDC050389 TaxID=3155516 RepID=UPI0033DAD239
MGTEKTIDGDAVTGIGDGRRLQRNGAQDDSSVFLTSVGLRFPRRLDFADWERAGRRLTRIVDSSAWCLGDWAVYGKEYYPDRYARAVEATGLDYGTLRNYASVARRVPLSRRRDALSFQHHAEVAALPADEQEAWLEKAEKKGWSRNQLRHQLRLSRSRQPDPEKPEASLRRLSFDAELVDRWRVAAERSGVAFEEWMISILDSAATEALYAEQAKKAG